MFWEEVLLQIYFMLAIGFLGFFIGEKFARWQERKAVYKLAGSGKEVTGGFTQTEMSLIDWALCELPPNFLKSLPRIHRQDPAHFHKFCESEEEKKNTAGHVEPRILSKNPFKIFWEDIKKGFCELIFGQIKKEGGVELPATAICLNRELCWGKPTVWHEAAHAHHWTLDESFNKKWVRIANSKGEIYHQHIERNGNGKGSFRWKDNQDSGPKHGCVHPYGAQNIMEDIATYCEAAYCAIHEKNEGCALNLLSAPIKDERYRLKLELLHEYGFITKEHLQMILALRDFHHHPQ